MSGNYIEEFFSLSAKELERRLDKLEYGDQSLFMQSSEDYPKFVEKVIFQPKRCNVHFPPIGPRAFSRGVKSTSSLPDIRQSEELMSSTLDDITDPSSTSTDKKLPTANKPKVRLGSPCLLIKEQHRPQVDDKKSLFCQGKGFSKPNKLKGTRSYSEKAENISYVEKKGLPKIDNVKPQTQVGPWFRAWSTNKREAHSDGDAIQKDVDSSLNVIEQKAVRSFDLNSLLKNAQENNEARHQNTDDITMATAANYISQAIRSSSVSAKGGGFMNRTKHVSVRDEILIKKKLRQKLFSFYDFGGSSDAFERIVSDVCSAKNLRVKFKNLPAYPDQHENTIFPLAAPLSNLPLLPSSPDQLQKLCSLLDSFPWYAWQPSETPGKQSGRAKGYHHSKHCITTSSKDIDDALENSKLEVRLPTCSQAIV